MVLFSYVLEKKVKIDVFVIVDRKQLEKCWVSSNRSGIQEFNFFQVEHFILHDNFQTIALMSVQMPLTEFNNIFHLKSFIFTDIAIKIC